MKRLINPTMKLVNFGEVNSEDGSFVLDHNMKLEDIKNKLLIVRIYRFSSNKFVDIGSAVCLINKNGVGISALFYDDNDIPNQVTFSINTETKFVQVGLYNIESVFYNGLLLNIYDTGLSIEE